MSMKKSREIKLSFGQWLSMLDIRNRINKGNLDDSDEQILEILGQELFDELHSSQQLGILTNFVIKSKEEHTQEELSTLGFQGLLQIGFSRKEARELIGNNLKGDAVALKVFIAMHKDKPEQLAKLEREWREDGVTPPWL